MGAALAVVAVGAFVLRPGKTEVQVTSVVTTYPSQQYAQLTASGYVVAQRRAAVASKATGRLEVLNVREGSLVKQGDVLARLDASDVRAALAQAQAGIRQAEAAVAQAGWSAPRPRPTSNASRPCRPRGLCRRRRWRPR